MRKIFRIALIFCLILSMIQVPTYALQNNAVADSTVIRPMFTYILTMAHYFDINNMGKATANALLSALDCDELKVEVKLQQYDSKNYTWKTIKTWSHTEEDTSCGAGGNYYVVKGMYRSVATGYVYVNGKLVEEHEMISSVKVYE